MRRRELFDGSTAGTYKWFVVGMLWWVCFFNYADRQAIFSLFPLLKSELQLSDVQLGIAGSSFMWMYAVAGPFAGWICDLVPRRLLILGGLMLWSAATAGTAHSHGFAELVAWRALGGLAEAFYFPASMSLISDYHAVDTRSRAMSIHQSSVYVGSAAGGAISGMIGQQFGDWRVSFVLFGGLGIVLALVLWTLLREAPRGLSDHSITPVNSGLGLPTRVAKVLSRESVLLLVAAFIGANFVAVLFLSWMPSFLYRRFHLGLAMSGINGTLYLSVASCVGTLVGGWLADSLTTRAMRRTGEPRGSRMLTQSFGLLAGAPFLFLAGYGTRLTTVVIAMTFFGLCKGVYDSNIWAALYDVVPIEQRGTAVGVMNSLGWLGGGLAPVAIAVAAARFGMGPCISATAAIYFGFGMLLYASARRRTTLVPPHVWAQQGN